MSILRRIKEIRFNFPIKMNYFFSLCEQKNKRPEFNVIKKQHSPPYNLVFYQLLSLFIPLHVFSLGFCIPVFI